MGFADRFVPVIFVQSSRPPRFQIDKVAHCRRLYWLTAAVDTAARAAHDLDEVVVRFRRILTDFEDFLGVAQSGSNRNLHLQVADFVGCFFDALRCRELRRTPPLHALSPVSYSTAVRSAASITPPVAPKITPAPVEMPRGASNSSSGSLVKVHARALDHPGQLTGGQRNVYIRIHRRQLSIVTA